MARATNQELQELVEALRAENAALRSERSHEATETTAMRQEAYGIRRRRGWGWTLLATVLIVIGSLLAPVAVVANWARAELSDTDTFVATFAPLAKDRAVRAFVSDEVVSTIQRKVDIEGLTSDVFDGITDLGLGPRASNALQALKAPAAAGIVSLIRNIVTEFVSSKAFASIWEETLRTTHAQLIATMQNNPDAAVSVAANGEIGLQLKPIITRVKTLLVDRGVTFAANIPAIDRTIVIAKSDAASRAQSAYGLVIAVGQWLQWVALAFLVAGVLVARRRSVALVWAAIGLALGMIVLAASLGIARLVFVGSVSPSVIPTAAATVMYNQVIAFVQSSAVAVSVLAVTVAVIAWVAGPFRLARRLRGLSESGAAAARSLADRHRLSTGRVGEWLYRQRVLLRAVVAAAGAAIVLLVRPLTPGLIVWTAVICIVVVAVLGLLQRPVVTIPPVVDDDAPIRTA